MKKLNNGTSNALEICFNVFIDGLALPFSIWLSKDGVTPVKLANSLIVISFSIFRNIFWYIYFIHM